MKKSQIISGVVIIILLVLILAVKLLPEKDFEGDNSEVVIKEEPVQNIPVDLKLAETIEFLEGCIEQSKLSHQNRSYEYLGCYKEPYLPNKEEIDKLRLIENVQGLEKCNLGRNEGPCILSDHTSNECDVILQIDYATMGTRPYPESISISECGDEHYIRFSTVAIAGPASTKIYQLDLSEDIIEALKD
jgi:hypothetical protein